MTAAKNAKLRRLLRADLAAAMAASPRYAGCGLRNGLGYDGAGAARGGWWAVHPCRDELLGDTLATAIRTVMDDGTGAIIIAERELGSLRIGSEVRPVLERLVRVRCGWWEIRGGEGETPAHFLGADAEAPGPQRSFR